MLGASQSTQMSGEVIEVEAGTVVDQCMGLLLLA